MIFNHNIHVIKNNDPITHKSDLETSIGFFCLVPRRLERKKNHQKKSINVGLTKHKSFATYKENECNTIHVLSLEGKILNLYILNTFETY